MNSDVNWKVHRAPDITVLHLCFSTSTAFFYSRWWWQQRFDIQAVLGLHHQNSFTSHYILCDALKAKLRKNKLVTVRCSSFNLLHLKLQVFILMDIWRRQIYQKYIISGAFYSCFRDVWIELNWIWCHHVDHCFILQPDLVKTDNFLHDNRWQDRSPITMRSFLLSTSWWLITKRSWEAD